MCGASCAQLDDEDDQINSDTLAHTSNTFAETRVANGATSRLIWQTCIMAQTKRYAHATLHHDALKAPATACA